MIKVLTIGTFDLFHSGHVNFLRMCWNLAGNQYEGDTEIGFVTVAVNSDAFVKKFKGKAPIYSYTERVALLSGCKYVGNVTENKHAEDLKPLIVETQPQILVVGSDWAKKDYYAQTKLTQDWLDIRRIVLCYVPYTEGISTTLLKERILNS